jgi:hypothetical protein
MCSSSTDTSLAARVRALTSELAGVEAVPDAELRTRLVELEQMRNTLEAEQGAVMVEMHRRAEVEDAERDGRLASGGNASDYQGRVTEFVSDEIGVLLACTRMAAAHRLETAMRATAHQSLMAAWREGTVDARKVAVIGDGLLDVDPAFAETLAGEAARYATSRTATQTRAWLARRVLSADPGMAEVRRVRASAGRRVTLQPVADGMAELSALLPGIQARQAFDTLNALAQAGATGDARTADQRRADALMDLLTGRADPPQVQIQVVVPADTLTGDTDQPGWVQGLGPITASEARTLAQGPPAGRGTSPTQSPRPKVRTLIVDPETGALTKPASTEVAPPLDPGQPLDEATSEPQYRPSRGLDRAVRERDVTCRFPGCRRSALTTTSGTDLDHTVPYPAGVTDWSNLAVLCRRHHRLKHSAGWQTELAPDGIMTWTTPTGRRYPTEPWAYLEPPDTS